MKKTSRLAATFMFIAAASLSISITGCGTSKQTTATQQQAQQQSVPEEINTGVAANIYDDTPKPRRKGTSSYVAMMPDGTESIIIGVFNAATYLNLIEQVKTGGFKLDMAGDEDAYTNGRYNIYCYSGRKTVRIEKVR